MQRDLSLEAGKLPSPLFSVLALYHPPVDLPGRATRQPAVGAPRGGGYRAHQTGSAGSWPLRTAHGQCLPNTGLVICDYLQQVNINCSVP